MKKCSFCGRLVRNYEEGIKGIICEPCADNLKEIFELKAFAKDSKNIRFTPPSLKSELDKYVIGQNEAKKRISLEVCNHLKKININTNMNLPKNNILMIGATGSGKTYLMEVLSSIIDIPVVIGDATGLTETGYKGKDVESLLLSLISKANGDVSLAEKGIIYIDEIDKLHEVPSNSGREVGGLGVQNALLKILEGMDYTFDKDGTTINTRNILFICGGAFTGLDKVVEKRVKIKNTIGFGKTSNLVEKEVSKDILFEDLLSYGLKSEFIGRFTNIITLDTLTEIDLVNILSNSKGSILKQYENLLKLEGIKLVVEDKALESISKLALKKGVGARGLNQIISNKLSNILFDTSEFKDSTLTINEEMFFK